MNLRPALASMARIIAAFYAESGNGKTRSALNLACGFVGGRARMDKVVMIETEAGRGEAYADDPEVGGYNVVSMREDFGPKRYGEAITVAERAGAEVLIIDSASHEWEGAGGVLMQAGENQAAGKKGPLVWQQPKMHHQREFIGRILQTPCPLVIACLRAKYPMIEATAKDVERWVDAGKPGGDKARPKVGEWFRSWRLEPKQSEDFLYECFVHGWIDDRHALHVTKYTLDDLRAVIVDGEPVTVATGTRLAAWAKRRKASPVPAAASPTAPTAPVEPASEPASEPVTREPVGMEGEGEGGREVQDDEPVEPISADQRFVLETAAKERGVPIERLLAKAHLARLAELAAADYDSALAWIHRQPKGGALPTVPGNPLT